MELINQQLTKTQEAITANRAIQRKKEAQWKADPSNWNENGVHNMLPITYEFWDNYQLNEEDEDE